MVVRKRKHSRKFRGSRRHGYGYSKQHQGKGHRGGKGNAGLGKRGQQNMTKLYSLGIHHLGRTGMLVAKRNVPEQKAITIRDMDLRLEGWASQNAIKKEKDVFIVDLKALGYDKLLSSGNLNHKVKIIGAVSEGAKKKIAASGGTVQ